MAWHISRMRCALCSVALALMVLILTVEVGCSSGELSEQQRWQECEGSEVVGPCDVYLHRFPGGLHAGAASDRKSRMVWKYVDRENSITGYQYFLDQTPKGDPNYSLAAA